MTNVGTESEYFKQLDSLFRFYGSEITAHASYLVGWSFAFAVFSYRLIDGIEEHTLTWYNILARHNLIHIVLAILFIISFIWLYGRLVFYNELGQIVQDCMGITQQGKAYFKEYQEFIERHEKKTGLATLIPDILSQRIRHSLLKQIDDDFMKMVASKPINKGRAILITFSNIRHRKYWNILKEIINEQT